MGHPWPSHPCRAPPDVFCWLAGTAPTGKSRRRRSRPAKCRSSPISWRTAPRDPFPGCRPTCLRWNSIATGKYAYKPVLVCSDHGFQSDKRRPDRIPAVSAGIAIWYRAGVCAGGRRARCRLGAPRGGRGRRRRRRRSRPEPGPRVAAAPARAGGRGRLFVPRPRPTPRSPEPGSATPRHPTPRGSRPGRRPALGRRSGSRPPWPPPTTRSGSSWPRRRGPTIVRRPWPGPPRSIPASRRRSGRWSVWKTALTFRARVHARTVPSQPHLVFS